MSGIDLARIKDNIGIMIGKGATDADIQQYVAHEGTTQDAVKNFKTDKPIMYGRGQLPIPGSTQGLLTKQDFVDAAMMVPATGVEMGVARGLEAGGGMLAKAFPEAAETIVEGNFLPDAVKIAKGATAGGAGGAVFGAGTGRPVGGMAAIGAGMGAVGPAIGAGYQAVRHPIETTGKVIDSAVRTSGKILKPIVKPAVRNVLDSDNPLYGGKLKADLASPEAQKARELGKRIGVNFSAAEQTGNTMARGVEDTLANSPRWSGKFAEANEQKTDAVVKKFKETLSSVSPQETNVAQLGERLTKAYKESIDSLVATRRAQSDVDFESARQATGGAPVIVPNNYIKVLNDFVKEGASPTATKEQIVTGKQAAKRLQALTEKPAQPSGILDSTGKPIQQSTAPQYKKITVTDLQNGLNGYGEAAKSPGSITGGLKTASDRRFAKAAKNAFEDDLNVAADSATGEGAAALKMARDNYRKVSGKIGDIQQTAIGKIVGGAQRNSEGELIIFPEKISDRFLSMEPSEIKATLKFLDQEHPDVAMMARRHTLESAYKQASEGAGQSSAGGIKNFDMKKFVEGLPNDAKLEAIMGSHKAVGEVKDVAEALNRLRWYGGRKVGSQTFGRQEQNKIFEGLKGWGAKKLYQSALDDTLAEDMLNPQKRAEFTAEANKINGKLSADQALGAETDLLAKP